MIAGLLKPTSGRIVVNGHDLAANPEAAKASLGFIPDRPYIYEKLTAGEFLRFHAGLYGMNGNGLDQRVREMLDLFELGRWEHELVESFSHGMKQRLVMCAAFLHRPQAVLVDEPMVGLDPRGAKLIKSVFRRMSEHGVAILMSTHTLEVAQEMCDRISIILKGKIIARGTVDELRAMAGQPARRADAGVPEADGRHALAGRWTRLCRQVALALRSMQPFTYLLLPAYWSSRNRVRRSERGDLARAWVFGGVALLVFAALFWGAFWITTQLDAYDELGDFLLRIGLSWLFLTFLSFLAFSGVVTALSTFFLSEDLRLLLATPVAVRRLFYARFVKTVLQSSWMVVVFLLPVLLGVGIARCAPCMFYVTALLTVAPFCVIPVAAGTGHDAAARERVSRAPRARHPDADGPRLRRQHRPAAALHPAGAAVARRVAARRHRVLRDTAVADHADAAVVLGGRNAVRQPGRRPRPAARGRAVDDRVRVHRAAERGQRAVVFCGLQQVAGGAQGALHAAAHARHDARRGCRCRSCAGIC